MCISILITVYFLISMKLRRSFDVLLSSKVFSGYGISVKIPDDIYGENHLQRFQISERIRL